MLKNPCGSGAYTVHMTAYPNTDRKSCMMSNTDIAQQVLDAVGGKDNVKANDLCMTRIRILTAHPDLIDTERLGCIKGVLGYARRGTNGIEVVFGPGAVSDVHKAIVDITGIQPSFSPFMDSAYENMNPIRVQINGHAPMPHTMTEASQPSPEEDDSDDISDAELDRSIARVASMLDEQSELDNNLEEDVDSDTEDDFEPDEVTDPLSARTGWRVLVINGPNLNMLGVREPDIYGKKSYADLVDSCRKAAVDAGFAVCHCFQSNHEGDLIDAIQAAYEDYDGIVINPGAYTHTSIALLDAVKSVMLPTIEVHMSNVDEREEFRKISYIRAACIETVMGMGIDGYRKAIFDLADYLTAHQEDK